MNGTEINQAVPVGDNNTIFDSVCQSTNESASCNKINYDHTNFDQTVVTQVSHTILTRWHNSSALPTPYEKLGGQYGTVSKFTPPQTVGLGFCIMIPG